MNIPLHPMLVHFPIALLIMSVAFDAAGTIWKRECFREGALWLLVCGLVGGIAAALAGDMAEDAAKQAGIAEALIENHETFALTTLGIFGILLLWRVFLRNQFSLNTIKVYMVVAMIGLGTLSVAGHFGGNLVYEHGAGVHTAIQGPSAMTQLVPGK